MPGVAFVRFGEFGNVTAFIFRLGPAQFVKLKIYLNKEIDEFVETHLCKLRVICRSRMLRVTYDPIKDTW